MPTASPPLSRRTLGEVQLEFLDRGEGRPMLVLHGAGGPFAEAPFIDMLAQHGRVIAPTHPGFGSTELPDWFESIDDLAYLYLDLLDALDLRNVILIGASMGGWTAAEIAVRNASRLAGLVLVDAVGVKVSDRETRDITDIFATPAGKLAAMVWHDPTIAPNPLTLPDDQLEIVARNRAASAMYLWEPYAHNPKLLRRLHRVTVPTLVLWGESDGLVTTDYGRAYTKAIPGAEFRVIPSAGHVPHLERPKVFTDHVIRFLSERGA